MRQDEKLKKNPTPMAPSPAEIKQMDFSKLDKYALATPKEETESIERLSRYLVKPAKNDLEKTRLLAVWIAKNILYDWKSYKANSIPIKSSSTVLETRTGVCHDYTMLFIAMADEVGLKAIYIRGYAKGDGYFEDQNVANINHAWNGVYIYKTWYLLDVTWMSTGLNPDYFLSDPEFLISNHYPSNVFWTLLSKPPTLYDFKYKWKGTSVQSIPVDQFEKLKAADQTAKNWEDKMQDDASDTSWRSWRQTISASFGLGVRAFLSPDIISMRYNNLSNRDSHPSIQSSWGAGSEIDMRNWYGEFIAGPLYFGMRNQAWDGSQMHVGNGSGFSFETPQKYEYLFSRRDYIAGFRSRLSDSSFYFLHSRTKTAFRDGHFLREATFEGYGFGVEKFAPTLYNGNYKFYIPVEFHLVYNGQTFGEYAPIEKNSPSIQVGFYMGYGIAFGHDYQAFLQFRGKLDALLLIPGILEENDPSRLSVVSRLGFAIEAGTKLDFSDIFRD